MSITMERSKLVTALKQVFNTGKYGLSGSMKTGNISDYVYIYAPETGEDAPVYFLNGNDFTFVKVKMDANVDEVVKPSVLDITSLRKYLGRWRCEHIIMAFSDTFSMWGDGSVTLPLIAEHPYNNGLQSMNSNFKSVGYYEERTEDTPSKLTATERVTYDVCLQLDGDDLKTCLSNCELVGTGVYTFDWDGSDTLTVSSQNTSERYNTDLEAEDLFQNNEPATMQMTMPLNSFINAGDKCNLYLQDEFPLLIVTSSEALIYRAPYRPN